MTVVVNLIVFLCNQQRLNFFDFSFTIKELLGYFLNINMSFYDITLKKCEQLCKKSAFYESSITSSKWLIFLSKNKNRDINIYIEENTQK